MNKRNQYTAEFKTMVVPEVLREEGTVSQIAALHGVNPVVLERWKTDGQPMSSSEDRRHQKKNWKKKESM